MTARIEAGERYYREGDAEIAAACGRLARTASTRVTCARSARPPGASRRSSSSSSRPGCGRATRSGGGRRSRISRRSPAVATELAQHLLVRDLRDASER